MSDVEHHIAAERRKRGGRGEVDRAIARLAERQYGVVSRSQLVALGLTRGAIGHRLSARRLHPLHRGVYAVGHRRLVLRGHWMAAVLAYGPGTLLSHRSGASHWDLTPAGGSPIEVTVTSDRRSHPGTKVHLARHLHPEDRTVRDGIPVTSVARTLLDLAEVIHPQRLARAFEEADRLQLLDTTALHRLCERSHGRHGLKHLLPLLARTTPAPRTRSELERRFLDLIRAAGITEPVCNTMVHGLEVDTLWPTERVIVELDGYGYHRHRAAFDRDRDRALALEAAGFRVLRVTWRELEEQPTLVIAAVRRALEAPTAARRSVALRG